MPSLRPLALLLVLSLTGCPSSEQKPDEEPEATFALELGAPAVIARGKVTAMPVRVRRTEATSGALLLRVAGLPAHATSEGGRIEAGADEGTLPIEVGAAALGSVAVEVTVTGEGHASTHPLTLEVRDPGGALDQGFGDGGRIVEARLTGSYSACDVLADARGHSYTVRLSSEGHVLEQRDLGGGLVSTFGEGGRVVLPLIPAETGTRCRIAPGPAGSVYVAGNAVRPFQDVFVARVRPDGGLDTAFSGDGVVWLRQLFVPIGWWFGDLAVRPSGELLLVTSKDEGWFAVQLDEQGRLDPRFDVDGAVEELTAPERVGGLNAVALTLLPQQGWAVGLVLEQGPAYSPGLAYRQRLYVRRGTGEADPAFGDGGAMTLRSGTQDYVSPRITALTADPQGRLLAGVDVPSSDGHDPAKRVARVLPSGMLDTGFGEAGWVRATSGAPAAPYAYTLNTLVALPDGKVLAGATVDAYNGIGGLGVFRFLPNGQLDPALAKGEPFYAGQKERLDHLDRYWTELYGMSVLPDGRVLVYGNVSHRNDDTGVMLARFWL